VHEVAEASTSALTACDNITVNYLYHRSSTQARTRTHKIKILNKDTLYVLLKITTPEKQ